MNLDKIIIVDNSEERAQKLCSLANGKAREVELMMTSTESPMGVVDAFRGRMTELLQDGQDVMVVFCCMTGVRGGIVNVLREVEAEAGKGTRRILVDCHGTSTVNKGFKERGVPRGGIRHIVYDQDERWQGKFAELF